MKISSNLEGNILMPPDQFGIDINDQTSNVYLKILAIRFENLHSAAVILVLFTELMLRGRIWYQDG